MTRTLGLAALPLLLLACNDQGFQKVADYGGVYESSIAGRVCDTTRNVWLEGATVYTHIISDDGELIGTAETVTDAEGHYQLAELRGDTSYTVYVQYGSSVIDMFDVPVEGTEQVTLPDPICSSDVNSTVAIVSGDYDNLDEVLPAFGVTDAYLVNGQTGDDIVQFLQSADNLAQYEAIFFAGGHIEEDVFYDTDGTDVDGNVTRVLTAVKDYVDAGGTLVATDWSYDIIEQAWPNKLDFLGDDTVPNAAQLGTPDTVDAQVLDTDLAAAVGGSTVPVHFDLDTWPVVVGSDESVTVYEMADAPYRVGMDTFTQGNSPLLVSFPVGDGKVIVSSWRLSANTDGGGRDVVSYLLGML
jgi:hypothetical protein